MRGPGGGGGAAPETVSPGRRAKGVGGAGRGRRPQQRAPQPSPGSVEGPEGAGHVIWHGRPMCRVARDRLVHPPPPPTGPVRLKIGPPIPIQIPPSRSICEDALCACDALGPCDARPCTLLLPLSAPPTPHPTTPLQNTLVRVAGDGVGGLGVPEPEVVWLSDLETVPPSVLEGLGLRLMVLEPASTWRTRVEQSLTGRGPWAGPEGNKNGEGSLHHNTDQMHCSW